MEPPNQPLSVSFFVGQPVEHVTFSAYQLNIYFAKGAWIQIESGYLLERAGSSLELVHAFPVAESRLMQLVGKTVAGSVISDTEFLLLFEGDYRLSVLRSPGPYESYRISDGTTKLVV